MPAAFTPRPARANVALTGLARDLESREKAGKPIRIGLVGCGEMGTDFICRAALMQGLRVGAVCARRAESVFAAEKIAYNETSHARAVNTASAMNAAIEADKIAACEDLDLLLACPLIEVIVDATGDPEAGAEIGYKALQNGKHVVMMNVEADVCIGPYLKAMADKAGLVYTLGAGDEPSACMELIEFIAAQGHKIVAAGKGKNNPLKVDAAPDAYEEEALLRNMNPRMLVEFIDGSKTMVEMAAIANATGLTVDCPGMRGPDAPLDRLSKVLIPREEGGILSQKGVVDYSVGKGVAPGVFAIAEMREPRIRERMEDLKLGSGPYFTFYRPFHLTAMEVPLSCARAALYGQADMAPLMRRSAEVCAVAKRDLAAGESLDFIGLYTYRAFTLTAAEAEAKQALPCGLLRGAKITRAVKTGELFTIHNCAPNPDQWIARLRKEQDKMLRNFKYTEEKEFFMPITNNTQMVSAIDLTLNVLIALAANEPEKYPFSKSLVADMKMERSFIRNGHYKVSHKIDKMDIGKGDNPVLYQNTETEESRLANYGADFVLHLHDLEKIFLEVTQCVDPIQEEIHNNPQYKPNLHGRPYSLPVSSKPNLTKKEKIADRKRQQIEGQNFADGGIANARYGTEPDKRWAERIVRECICKKIEKYKTKLAQQVDNNFKEKSLWLIIKTDCGLDWGTPFEKLLPFLIKQLEKENITAFSPFARLIIMNATGFLVFDKDRSNYKIWSDESLEW